MKTVWSARDVVPAKDAFDAWHEVMCQTIFPHDSKQLNGAFAAEVKVGRLHDLSFILWDLSSANSIRTMRHVGKTDSENFVLHLLLKGRRIMEPGSDAELVMKAGDMCLVDSADAYRVSCPDGAKILSVKIPYGALRERLPMRRIKLAIARRIEPSPGDLASSISGFLQRLAERGLSPLKPDAQEMHRDHAIDMVARLVGKMVDSQPRIGSHARLHLDRMQRVLELRFADPRLNRDDIAKAAGITVRNANYLLQRCEETSLTEWLDDYRLRQCAQALSDPNDSRSINEIAIACGIRDLSHFGRAFKIRFGMTPSEWRFFGNHPPR